MPCKTTNREDDETLLHWLQLRDSVKSCGQIGKKFGVPSNRVRTATNRVYDAAAAA